MNRIFNAVPVSFFLACLFETALVVVAVVFAWAFNQPLFAGLQWSAPDALLGFTSSFPLFVLFLWTSRSAAQPLVRIRHILEEVLRPLLGPWPLWQLAVISALAGLFEELLFRGVLQAGLTPRVGPVLAIIAASLLFGLVHPLTWAYLLLATLIGAYLGGLYYWSGNLLVPIVAHAVYDFAALVFFLRYNLERDQSRV